MKLAIHRLVLALCGLLLAWAAGGCANVTVRAAAQERAATPPPVPAEDGRSEGRIRQDNAALRATMATLEQKHDKLLAAVEDLQRRKDQLKDRREQVEKDRDRYKKLSKKED